MKNALLPLGQGVVISLTIWAMPLRYDIGPLA